jgi:hypothetical protein
MAQASDWRRGDDIREKAYAMLIVVLYSSAQREG